VSDRLGISVVISALVYIALGLWLKGVVLNWIVGPLWLLITVYLLPAIVQMIGDRRAAAPRSKS